MKNNNKKEQTPELLTVIPDGDPEKFNTFYAEHFELLYVNGKVGTAQITPDKKMVANMQKNIEIALGKIQKYVKELETAQEFLKTIECIESYDALYKEAQAKKEVQASVKPKLK